jgi:serine/threonine protein kinase/tetratricopeptide (TPR) repeat protein
MLGQTISHYRITQKLGAGGMGVVYKAIDLKLERVVALKFLPQDMVVTGSDRERLLREARAASMLDHPNIGVIHGLEESDDRQFFIVMGYYEGMTLAERLDRGVVPIREALDLAIQIARGLSAAHARNIVHRDVKPSNVIITPDSVVKIVDFGLARVVASASATQSISLTGTLPYMAPEQILGEPVDQRSDVWALGVVLVQMITGSHPFVRPNTAAMTFAILNQAPAALDAVPDAVRPVIYRTLSKKPEHRQANASELLSDLESARAQITATPPVSEHPTLTRNLSPRELKKMVQNASTPTWNEPSSRWATRAALVAMILLLLLTGTIFLPPVRERLAGMVYASTDKHIAVLPFKNDGNDPAFEPVATGFGDSLTNDLSNLEAAQEGLWVVPASQVHTHHITDASEAFRVLGASMVVEGKIRRKGSVVDATVVLIDAKHMRQIGSADVENRSGDLADLQDQAIHHLVRLIGVKASDDARTPDSKGSSTDTYESYLRGVGLLQRYDKTGNIEQAIDQLRSAVGADPRFALGYAALCDAYRLKYATQRDAAAIGEASANCQKALQIDPSLASVHVNLGAIDAASGRYDQALHEYQSALAARPKDAEALDGIADVYEQTKLFAEAESSFKQAISLRPTYWVSYQHLALFYNRRERYTEAIALLNHVIELTPDNATAYSNLGAVYWGMEDAKSREAAQVAFSKSIALSPSYAAYSNLGYLYLGNKQYNEAAEAFQRALALNDKDWRVWANLFIADQWLNDPGKIQVSREAAIQRIEQALSVAPQDSRAHAMLGTLYGEGDRDKAISHIQTALRLEPKDADILADAAVTYDQLGERKRAIEYASASLANGSDIKDLQAQPGLQSMLADPSFRPRGKK